MLQQVDKFLQLILSKIKDGGIFHRGFFKPIEIQLKTFNTEFQERDSKLRSQSLPAGLKIVFKQCFASNKYELQNVVEIAEERMFRQLEQRSQDNLLSLMKNSEGIQVAICICMYNEDKRLLRDTLAGVAENISNIVLRENISSDKIGVFVLMDGMEKVDESVVSYFEYLQKQSNINFGVDFTLQEVNSLLFDCAQLQDRNQRRLSSVLSEYRSIQQLRSIISKLIKRVPQFEDLPNRLRPFFIEEARKLYKQQYSVSDQNVYKISEEKLIQEYANDLRRHKPLMVRALYAAQGYCDEYMAAREDLAYLSCFRTKVRHNTEDHPIWGNQHEPIYRNNNSDDIEELQNEYFTYMNLFMCVQYNCRGQVSLHNWFFNGFCKELRSKYAVLLDVGIKPEGQAIWKMYKHLESNQKVGKVCGYESVTIRQLEYYQANQEDVDFLTNISFKFADIQRAQQFQHHFMHLVDKPFQAFFGFIYAPSGSFSAYRMKAIQDYDRDDDNVILRAYCKYDLNVNKIVPSELGIKGILHRVLLPDILKSCSLSINYRSQQQNLYNENIFFAKDIVLSTGIYVKQYDIVYLPDATAEINPAKTVHALLGQKKRFLNGSYFAFEQFKSNLSLEFMIRFQVLFLTLMNTFDYFSPAFCLFAVHIGMEAVRDNVLIALFCPNTTRQLEFYDWFVKTVDFIYVILLMLIVYFSLHFSSWNRRFKPYIYAISTVLGILSIIVVISLSADAIKELAGKQQLLTENQHTSGPSPPEGIVPAYVLGWILIGAVGVFSIPVILYIILFKKFIVLWQIIMGIFSFLFYAPTYLNIINIYALCRIDDIPLRTNRQSQWELKYSWKVIKLIRVARYFFWNITVGAAIFYLWPSYTQRFNIIIGVIGVMGAGSAVKIVISAFYMIKYKCCCCSCKKAVNQPRIVEQSRMKDLMDYYKHDILQKIRENANQIRNQYCSRSYHKRRSGSFIQLQEFKGKTYSDSYMSRDQHFSNIRRRQAEQKKFIGPIGKPAQRVAVMGPSMSPRLAASFSPQKSDLNSYSHLPEINGSQELQSQQYGG